MKYPSYLLLMMLVFGSIGCRQTGEYQIDSTVADNQQKGEEYRNDAPPDPNNDGIAIERKLIKEGSIEYRVDNIANARKQLLQATARWKGYIGSETEYNTSERNSTTFIIRVPAANFDSLLVDATANVRHVDRRDIQVRDVTEEYVDIEVRLKTKKELEQRYLELLKKATSVQDILEIEREIGTLRADIESIEGRLNVLKSQVSFSTLSLTIYEPVSAPGFFGERITTGFTRGWNYLLDFLVGLVYLWPFLLIGIGGYFGIRRWSNRKRVK
jgi:hypothetical protein